MNSSTCKGMNTSVASAIEAIDAEQGRRLYDRSCKRLLSEKDILAWILHECLEEFKGVSPQDIAQHYIEGTPQVGAIPLHGDVRMPRIMGIGSEDSTVYEGTVLFDIRFQAIVPGTDDSIGMMVNIEAQNDFHPGYSLLQRAMYYCARMISSQYGRVFSGSRYGSLQKVCSIWICPNPPRRFRNTVTRYSMSEQQLVGAASAPKSEYDLMEMVLVCPDGDRQQRGDGILRLLGTLFASDEDARTRKAVMEEEFGIRMTQRLSEEVDDMLDFSKGVMEKGIEQGIERGRSQERELLTRLAACLAAHGRKDELADALCDDNLMQLLLKEFGLSAD